MDNASVNEECVDASIARPVINMIKSAYEQMCRDSSVCIVSISIHRNKLVCDISEKENVLIYSSPLML